VRRLIILLGVIGAVLAIVVLTHPFTTSGYRVDAIFDTADGISSGMNVEVAGVPEGSVVGVALTQSMKARLQLQLDKRFAPFHTDARCQILPEGIISENYVECDPGSPSAPVLAATSGGRPTVPLTHDTEPVSLQQFIDIFSLPVADRLHLMLNELGIATAGRGEDINQILERANPSISQANRVLATIDAQRGQLEHAVSQTNQVISQLASGKQSVRRFVDEAATTAAVTAQHRGPLSDAINRLPAFLSEAGRTSDTLHQLSGGAVPLLNALRGDGPALTELTSTVPSFTATATPAVKELSALSDTGRSALVAARPAVNALHTFTSRAPTAVTLLDRFLTNVQSRGGIEYAYELFYALATAPAPFDGISHVITLNAIVTPCLATPTAAGCNRGWGPIQSRDPGASQVATPASQNSRDSRRTRHPSTRAAAHRPASPSTPASTPTTTATPPPSATTTTSITPTPPAPSQPAQSLLGLLGYLTK
jgi:phospholipid/cholesterol/gamma-HCH transport system substrate-binding protein